jgi:predicted O-methyltransferase YrrM
MWQVLVAVVLSVVAVGTYHVLVVEPLLASGVRSVSSRVRPARRSGPSRHSSDTAKLHAQLKRAHKAALRTGQVGEEELEGHSAQCGHKPVLHRTLVRQRAAQPRVQVCEIGFNLGHSALTWLSAAPNVRLLSFDLGNHEYSRVGAKFVADTFGADRFTIVYGDSQDTVPEHFGAHPGLRCDIFMVDGGHSPEVATSDLENAIGRVVPYGLLLIDDTNCAADFCVDEPWKAFVAKNKNRLVPGTRLEYRGPKSCHGGSGVSGAFVLG